VIPDSFVMSDLDAYLVDRIAYRLNVYCVWLHERAPHPVDPEPWLRWSLASVARVYQQATDEDLTLLAAGPPITPLLPLVGGTTWWMRSFWRAWEQVREELVIPLPLQTPLRTLIGHALDVVTERPASSTSARKPTS